MIIDIHPHIISTDTKRYPRAPVGGHQSDWSRERPVSMEQMIAAMDTAGIAKAALVQASTCYGHDSSYVADAVAAHPERFTGVFSVDVLDPLAVNSMEGWTGRDLTGLRIFTTGSTMPGQAEWLDDARSFPVWEFAQARNLPVCLQMTAKAIPQLVKILDRYPRSRVILDHLARPVQDDGPPYTGAGSLWGLAPLSQVYLKVTERNLVGASKGKATPETFFGKLISEFGAPRIAWGSNYPASEQPLPQLVKLAQQTLAFLPATDREWIFFRTAQTLYPALKDK